MNVIIGPILSRLVWEGLFTIVFPCTGTYSWEFTEQITIKGSFKLWNKYNFIKQRYRSQCQSWSVRACSDLESIDGPRAETFLVSNCTHHLLSPPSSLASLHNTSPRIKQSKDRHIYRMDVLAEIIPYPHIVLKPCLVDNINIGLSSLDGAEDWIFIFSECLH